ncbi:MAG TPA: DUF4399 domain-containing protein [Turneriella sp.]|nr:DUF4399 domain-containing protein [Turneriella sp.]
MKHTLWLIPLLVVFTFGCNKKKEFKGKVWFGEPLDKAELASPVKFTMHVEGMEVKPAGTMQEGTGHFHILINKTAVPAGEVVITDPVHIHYGKGQTEDTRALEPGDYTVTLQFADGAHVSYGPAWAQSIHIKVKK